MQSRERKRLASKSIAVGARGAHVILKDSAGTVRRETSLKASKSFLNVRFQ